MNKLSEIMNQIDIADVEKIDLQEYELSEEELEKLHTKVLRECHLNKRKRRIGIKGIILAAAIMVTSVSTLAYVSQQDWFESVFKDDAEKLGDSALIINKSCTDQNIKVTVRGIWGSSDELLVMYDVEKTDHIPFEGNELNISGYVAIDQNGTEEQFGLRMGTTARLARDEDGTKETYITTLSNCNRPYETYDVRDDGSEEVITHQPIEDFTGQKATLVIESIKETYEGQDEILIDPLKYAKDIEDKDTIAADASEFEEFSSIYQRKDYVGENLEKALTPTKILPRGNLNIQLFEKKPGWVLDNIGFIDGNLHVRCICNYPSSAEKDMIGSSNKYENKFIVEDTKLPLNNIYYKRDLNDHQIEQYYVYRLSSQELTDDISIYNGIILDYEEIDGDWEIPFTTDIVSNYKKLSSDITIPAITAGRTWSIDEIRLSNSCIGIKLISHGEFEPEFVGYADGSFTSTPNADRKELINTIKIKMQDGTELALPQYVDEGYSDEAFNINLIYLKAIDYKEISAIEINGMDVPIKG